MKKNAFKTMAEFKEFLYEPGEGHFFWFCDIHRNLLERKQDAVSELVPELKKKPPVCDWPWCRLTAACEFFPNLVTVLKRWDR